MSCRHAIYFQPIQNINLGGTTRQEPVSVHTAIQRHRGALSRDAGIARQDRDDSWTARRNHGSLRQKSASHRSKSIAKNPRYMVCPSIRSVRNSTTRSACVRSRPSTARSTTTRSFSRPSRSFRLGRTTWPRLSEDPDWHDSAAVGGDPFRDALSVPCRSITRASSPR